MVELFPPGALVIRRGADSPICRKGVSFEPVKDVECYGGMCDVDKGPRLEVMESGEEANQEPHRGYDEKVKGPCGGGVEPFHANIIRLGSVAGLHRRRGKGEMGSVEGEGTKGERRGERSTKFEVEQ